MQLAGITVAAKGRDAAGLAVARSAMLLDVLSEISAGENDDAMLPAIVGKLRWLIGFARVDLARPSDDGRSYRVRTLFEAQPDPRPPAKDTLPITEGLATSLLASEPRSAGSGRSRSEGRGRSRASVS